MYILFTFKTVNKMYSKLKIHRSITKLFSTFHKQTFSKFLPTKHYFLNTLLYD